MKTLSRRDLLKGGLVGGAAIAATAALAGCTASDPKASMTPAEANQRTMIEYYPEVVAMAKEIISKARPYTDAQLKEIPAILNCKTRYFWANDLQDWETMRDVFTDEAPDGFLVYMGGEDISLTPDEQVGRCDWSIGVAENIIPMHFGHNQIVHFIDDTHAQLLTRMHDRHTYKDDGEIYAGWGLYVDDLMKCKDGVWRIHHVRLSYGVMENQLRCVKRMMEEQQGG